MKRAKRGILLVLLAALLLAGCAKKDGITVNTVAKTVSDGNYTYHYTDETQGDTRTIVISYPDGNTYTWTQTGTTEKGAFSGLYNMDEYTHGEDLVYVILNPDAEAATDGTQSTIYNDMTHEINPEPEPEPKDHSALVQAILMGGLMIGLGIWQVIKPDTIWQMRIGRWIKNAEPSDEAIARITAFGIFEIVFGVIVIVIGIFI